MRLSRPVQTVDGKWNFVRGFKSTQPRHMGIDYGWLYSDPVKSKICLAAAPGRVTYTYYGDGNNQGWGRRVIIRVTDRAEIAYSHLSRVAMHAGEIVSRGQTVGTMGSTGIATGDHLHFELYVDGKRVDPQPYLDGKELPGTPLVKEEKVKDDDMIVRIKGQAGKRSGGLYALSEGKAVFIGFDANRVQSIPTFDNDEDIRNLASVYDGINV